VRWLFAVGKNESAVCAVAFFRRIFYVVRIFFKLVGNGLQLKEVGDFHHKCSYEAQMFVELKNCHTKHRATNFF